MKQNWTASPAVVTEWATRLLVALPVATMRAMTLAAHSLWFLEPSLNRFYFSGCFQALQGFPCLDLLFHRERVVIVNVTLSDLGFQNGMSSSVISVES